MSGREVVRAFEKHGWEIARQRGSHIILVKAGENATLSVPDHKEVGEGDASKSYPRRRFDRSGILRLSRKAISATR
jgi:predicted RNA binding protein YcfA (HicA-like mRNA interferase family)